MRNLTLLAVMMLAATPALAMDSDANGGLAFAWHFPQKELKESHDQGYGIHLMFAYELADKWDLSITTGWNRLLANEQPRNSPLGSDDITVWEFTAGPRLRLKWFYAGVEAGYFTKLDKWGWVPNAGVRYKILDLGWRWNSTGESEIQTIRLGVFF